jgi:hypothetical protein
MRKIMLLVLVCAASVRAECGYRFPDGRGLRSPEDALRSDIESPR